MMGCFDYRKEHMGFVKNGISVQDLSHCQTLKKGVELCIS